MRFGEASYGKRVVHDLEHRIRVGVEDMCLKTAVRCFIVKAAETSVKVLGNEDRERAPEVEILHAELRVLNFYLSINSGYFLNAIVDAQCFQLELYPVN
jgi:hypothetical protein